MANQTPHKHKKKVVLLGAGHAHVEVLRRFAKHPLRASTLTLVTPERLAPYTGLAHAVISGRINGATASIDASRLAAAAKASFITGHAEEIDRASKTITLSDKTRLSYDILSVDIGGVVTPWFDVPDGGPRVVGAKPASHVFSTIIDVFNEKRHPTVVVVGGGLGGIEIAAALKSRGAEVTLLTGKRGVAPNIHKKARKKISGRLSNLGINIVTKTKLTGVDRPRDPTGQDQTRSLAILENGKELVADLVVLATGVSSPPLFSSIPELLDHEGFLKINAYLASAVDGSIFAAGDCASLPLNDNQTRAPKAGVYAVKAGPTLAHNIRAAAEGRKFKWFDPPNHVLAITSLQSKGAIASKNRFVAGNPLLPSIKSLIDRRFIARHSIARHSIPRHSLGANKEKQPNTSVSK